MTFSKTITSLVLAATVAGAGLAPLSTAASAGEWHGYYGHEYRHDWRRDGRFYDYRRHDHFGRNVAIGAAATILGLAIAAEATRDRDYGYYRDRY